MLLHPSPLPKMKLLISDEALGWLVTGINYQKMSFHINM